MVTLNVPVVAPAAMVMLDGTKAGLPLVHSSTVKPPVGAAAFRVTVPVADTPPLTLVGVTDTEERPTGTAGVTVMVVVLIAPL